LERIKSWKFGVIPLSANIMWSNRAQSHKIKVGAMLGQWRPVKVDLPGDDCFYPHAAGVTVVIKSRKSF
jgi:hypothetical protein